MKRSTIHLWLCAALAVCGCYPERIVWSPDGQRALVATKERLYVCDPNGLLTPLGTGAYTCMAWLSDSNRFAAATTEKLTTWKDLEPLLSKEDRDRIIPLAEDMREDILKVKQVDLGKLESVQGKDNNDLVARGHLEGVRVRCPRIRRHPDMGDHRRRGQARPDSRQVSGRGRIYPRRVA
jgi:hypothetical protein